MYLPPHFCEERTDVLHALMRQHPLATLVTQPPAPDGLSGLEANLVPFVLTVSPAGTATSGQALLQAHVARNNPVVATLAQGGRCLVVFQGPQHYVSPSWYPAKAEGGRVVPTWNYATVHAWGTARLVEDPAWLMAQISALTDAQEAALPQPWAVADAPADYLAGMVRGIVGIEIAIDRLQGKWKVSQNRPVADRAGVHQGLLDAAARQPCPAQAMAALVAEHLPTPPHQP